MLSGKLFNNTYASNQVIDSNMEAIKLFFLNDEDIEDFELLLHLMTVSFLNINDFSDYIFANFYNKHKHKATFIIYLTLRILDLPIMPDYNKILDEEYFNFHKEIIIYKLDLVDYNTLFIDREKERKTISSSSIENGNIFKDSNFNWNIIRQNNESIINIDIDSLVVYTSGLYSQDPSEKESIFNVSDDLSSIYSDILSKIKVDAKATQTHKLSFTVKDIHFIDHMINLLNEYTIEAFINLPFYEKVINASIENISIKDSLKLNSPANLEKYFNSLILDNVILNQRLLFVRQNITSNSTISNYTLGEIININNKEFIKKQINITTTIKTSLLRLIEFNESNNYKEFRGTYPDTDTIYITNLIQMKEFNQFIKEYINLQFINRLKMSFIKIADLNTEKINAIYDKYDQLMRQTAAQTAVPSTMSTFSIDND